MICLGQFSNLGFFFILNSSTFVSGGPSGLNYEDGPVSCQTIHFPLLGPFSSTFMDRPLWPKTVYSDLTRQFRSSVILRTNNSKYPKLLHLKKAYKNQMLKLFQYVYDCNGEVECCSLQVQRFNWCQDYFCN